MNYFSSTQKIGKTVSQILHFSNGNKRTFTGIKTETIKQGEFTKMELTNGTMLMVNTQNVDCIEVIPEKVENLVVQDSFETDLIRNGAYVFILNDKLTFNHKAEGSNHIIENDYLDFSAFGSNEEEAKKAINFSFYALYQNYYLEKDDNLTKKAQELKIKLQKLVKKVIKLDDENLF